MKSDNNSSSGSTPAPMQKPPQKTPWYRALMAAGLMTLAAHPLVMYGSAPSTSIVAEDDITSSRQNAITRAVKVCSPAIVGISITETRTQLYRDPMEDMMMGEPFFTAMSMTFMILLAWVRDIEPPNTVKSWL